MKNDIVRLIGFFVALGMILYIVSLPKVLLFLSLGNWFLLTISGSVMLVIVILGIQAFKDYINNRG